MAYTMAHILIAEEVLTFIKAPVDYATYILGTIAPDAVHAAQNYSVVQKERSHLFVEGAKWGKILNENDFRKWTDNIQSFYIENHNRYGRDFFLGYIVHLYADVYSCKKIFAPFYVSVKDNFDEKMEQFRKENYSVNYYLYCEYSKKKNLYDILSSGHAYSIDGIFEKNLISPRITQLFSFEFNKKNNSEQLLENSICTVSSTRKLIKEVAENIKKIFLDEYNI